MQIGGPLSFSVPLPWLNTTHIRSIQWSGVELESAVLRTSTGKNPQTHTEPYHFPPKNKDRMT